ncbi:hypothetical protein FOA52_012665 [Chlamydomonas sp. UWO 241]|nr:hypothetical protein FOA52_012665 [Chlamydomonas sp. UWO 241]
MAGVASAGPSATSTSSVDGSGSGKRFTVSLKMPMGIVMEQNGGDAAPIVVTEVKAESAGEKEGVRVGDVLVATSGVTFSKEVDYNGVWVKAGETIVRLNVRGESFKTVCAAIRSHPGHKAVALDFQRPCSVDDSVCEDESDQE